MKRFTNESLVEIISFLSVEMKSISSHSIFEFEVLNPDIKNSTYAGQIINFNEEEFIYRSYKAWNDLASKLFCRILTPIKKSEHTVIISFEKLKLEDSFHKIKEQKEEKYGTKSTFSLINKNEEPEVLLTYLQALKNVNLQSKKRVLNLGINSAEEYELIKEYLKDTEK